MLSTPLKSENNFNQIIILKCRYIHFFLEWVKVKTSFLYQKYNYLCRTIAPSMR